MGFFWAEENQRIVQVGEDVQDRQVQPNPSLLCPWPKNHGIVQVGEEL